MTGNDPIYTDSIRTAIRRFCDYQERCHMDVRRKLYDLGAETVQAEEIIAELIAADLLNEERYAHAIASGKFRIKYWGKVKIAHHLKQHQVSAYCIKKALQSIDPEEYYESLCRLADKKAAELKGEGRAAVRESKLFRYLLQKGYESSLIREHLAAGNGGNS